MISLASADRKDEYARALVNILEDFAEERIRFKDAQTAVLNILDDFGIERNRLQHVQKAIYNILDDLHAEKERLENAQSELVRSAEVRSSLREKEVLLQELNHRVKNNLQVICSLINMQVRKVQDPSGREALEECQRRVWAIALIHEKLYQAKNYALVPFCEYAKSLAANVFHATGVSPANIKLEVEIDDVSLTVDKAIPCGLILNELISNALKHAFPHDRLGTLRVEVRSADEGEIVISVSDDGIGVPDGFDSQKSHSLGLQLVSTLVQQIDGELRILREHGTVFEIRFPLKAQT